MLINAIQSLFYGGGISWQSLMMQVLAVLFIIFFAWPVREFAKGFMALKLGDTTAKYQGRLTLNPIVSLDPVGTLFILLFGIGWGRPLPINTSNFRKPRRDTILVTLAGPVGNVFVAFLAALIFNIVLVCGAPYDSTGMQMAAIFVMYFVRINVLLAVFNLLPIPPLDGFQILAQFLSARIMHKYYQYQQFITMGLFLLLIMGVLSRPMAFLEGLVSNGVYFLAGLPFRAFGL